MSDETNVCYCGAYGGGVHTKSARCAEAKSSNPKGVDERFEAYVAHVVGEASKWRLGSGSHPPGLKQALEELRSYYYEQYRIIDRLSRGEKP